MKLRPQDVISHLGRDFVVEGILTYKLGSKSYRLAYAADGEDVCWVEPLMDELDDRVLLFREVKDLPLTTPPPPTIHYKGSSYVPRLSGKAVVDVEGTVPDRAPGACELWRYRAGGDIFVQLEKWSARTVALAGESVHKDMVQVFPGP
jgi:Domain of unknown function (DUF4178)